VPYSNPRESYYIHIPFDKEVIALKGGLVVFDVVIEGYDDVEWYGGRGNSHQGACKA
jgi:hypothetical protein